MSFRGSPAVSHQRRIIKEEKAREGFVFHIKADEPIAGRGWGYCPDVSLTNI
jgi:hypothetical protein